jgi:protein-L-isoaspartate O-methyltransferase
VGRAAGYTPRLIAGDGADGCGDGAPYDRVQAAGAVAEIPYAWVEQCRPGGIIVTPFSPGYGYGWLTRLHVLPDGTAVGGFPGRAGYMLMRSQRPVGLYFDETGATGECTFWVLERDTRDGSWASVDYVPVRRSPWCGRAGAGACGMRSSRRTGGGCGWAGRA